MLLKDCQRFNLFCVWSFVFGLGMPRESLDIPVYMPALVGDFIVVD